MDPVKPRFKRVSKFCCLKSIRMSIKAEVVPNCDGMTTVAFSARWVVSEAAIAKHSPEPTDPTDTSAQG